MDPKKSTDPFAASGDVADTGRLGGAPPDKAATGPSYDWLGPSLRRMYDEVLNEPIPDSFVDLLQQLYDRQKKRQS
jgi:hypothetical protein